MTPSANETISSLELVDLVGDGDLAVYLPMPDSSWPTTDFSAGRIATSRCR
jgi:hypothetical protein